MISDLTIKNQTLGLIAIWLMLTAGFPVSISIAFSYPYMIPLVLGLGIAISLLIVNSIQNRHIQASRTIVTLFIALFSFWILQMVFRLDIAYSSNLFQLFCIFVIYLTIYNIVGLRKTIKSYIAFNLIGCIGGSFMAIMVLLFNVQPLFMFEHHNGPEGHPGFFFYTTLTNIYYYAGGFGIIRYSGFFDEPGSVAFFGMFSLLVNRIFLKNKKVEMALILLPMLTFSLAHFATVIVYMALFYVKKAKTFMIAAVAILGVYMLLESFKETEYHEFYKITLGRLEMTDDGTIKGDNRTDLNALSVEHFKEAPVLGKGKTFFEGVPVGGIAYTGALYGFIGYFFVYMFLFYALIASLFKDGKFSIYGDGVKCCLIIIMNLFQRWGMSNIFQVTTLMLFALCIQYVVQNTNPQRLTFTFDSPKKI